MTVKQFLQSKIFRCIVVLLCIALVSGGLLAILNDLWHVSDEELIQRGIKEVCGDGVNLEKVCDINETYAKSDDGEVLQVLLLDNGDYLIKAQGKHGFQEGSVSAYVLFTLKDSVYEVKQVAVADYSSSQTLMSKITASGLAKFVGLSEPSTIKPSEIATGASYSSTAIKNAVNVAISYMQTMNKEG